MTHEARSHLIWGAVIVSVLFVAYVPSLDNQFVYDDRHLILENPLVEDIGNLPEVFGADFYRGLNYYRPLPLMSFMIDYRVAGPDPFVFHLTNVLLLVATGILLYFLLSELMGWRRRWLVRFATLLYVLHPVVSSVAMGIGARGDLLCLPLLILALYCYSRARGVLYLLSLLCFGLALLSKETAVTFSLLLLAFEALVLHPARRFTWTIRIVRRHAPYWVLLGAYFLIRSLVLTESVTEFTLSGTMVLKSYLYLLQTTLLPTMELVYEPWFKDWFSAWKLAIAGLLLIALTLVAMSSARERAKVAAF
jgi:hypothetical protein